jgi:hypothetical protein
MRRVTPHIRGSSGDENEALNHTSGYLIEAPAQATKATSSYDPHTTHFAAITRTLARKQRAEAYRMYRPNKPTISRFWDFRGIPTYWSPPISNLQLAGLVLVGSLLFIPPEPQSILSFRGFSPSNGVWQCSKQPEASSLTIKY